MQDYRNLAVWQKAHLLTLRIHGLSGDIPRYGNADLVSQFRRAALSIPANIAEGCGRSSDIDFSRFIQIAIGSSSELEYHLLFAADVGLISDALFKSIQPEVIEVRKMLIGLQKKLKPPVV